MNATAPQLELFRPKTEDPNVAWFVELLFVNASWMKAGEIIAKIPPDYEFDDRTIRAWAEAAAPKIISGQRGYKHTDHATPDEIKMFLNTMHSQGVKMLKRAQKVRKYAHAKIG